MLFEGGGRLIEERTKATSVGEGNRRRLMKECTEATSKKDCCRSDVDGGDKPPPGQDCVRRCCKERGHSHLQKELLDFDRI